MRILNLTTKFFVVFSLLLSGCLSSEYNVATHKQDIFFYSTEKEMALGQNIARKVASEYKISANPDDIMRVNQTGEAIVDVCDRKEISYYFYVIEDDEKNAFSVPGGYVYIYKGLLDLLDDDELTFVLAHEVGHIVSRHSIKRLQAAMGYNLLLIASRGVSSDPQFSKGLSFALAQIMAGYSREDEFCADELAVEYTKATGSQPKAGISVLEKLYQESKKKLRPISYFRTHPFTAPRIKHIKEVLRLPIDVDDYINF
ncbi:MAG: M48 family metalloprotease [Candidatus Omnitrophota bacterium]|nr:MAG: M48 family metalloprotease [Candidatus Omnitrophota bacterium]